ncbi:MAG: hypothetical protein K0Q91_2238 [Fibrobacteria bacterium]|jgi:hypothetical protein|nr:hypothetical protein [Fibrobacteria bacterium]
MNCRISLNALRALFFLAVPVLFSTVAEAAPVKKPAPTPVKQPAPTPVKKTFHEKNFTVSVQPALFLVPIFAASAEARLTEPLGVAILGGIGSFDYERDGERRDARVYAVGAQARFYFLDRRISKGNEPHVGLQALFARGSEDEEYTGFGGVFGKDAWGRGHQLMGGPFVGYKFVAPFGLTAEMQGGILGGSRYSEGGEGNTGLGENSKYEFKWLPIAHFSLGWSW